MNIVLCKMVLRHKVCRDKRQKKRSGGQKIQNKTKQKKYWRYFLLREKDTYFLFMTSLVSMLPLLLYVNESFQKFLVLFGPCGYWWVICGVLT